MSRTLLSAGAVLAVLLLVILTRWSDSQRAEDTAPLFALPKTDINRIEIRQGDEVLAMAKSEQGEWEIVGPNARVSADSRNIGVLLDAFAEPRVTPIEDGNPDLSAYQLEPPQRAISLSTVNGVQKTILVGRESPLGFSFYSKLLDSERIYLMPEVMVSILVADPKLFERPSAKS